MENDASAISALLQAVDAGGSVALVAVTYFIAKATERLARIEKALDKFMNGHDKQE